MRSNRLSGVRVVVTRAVHQAGSLTALLEAEGATVITAPVIGVADPEDWGPFDAALSGLHRYDAALIGSKNAVDAVRKRGHSISIPVIAVGRRTKAALEGLAKDVWLPEESNAEGMVALIAGRLAPLERRRFLFLRAPEGRETAIELLEAAGAAVDAVAAYRIVPVHLAPEVLAALPSAEVFTFLSGETLAAFLSVVPDGRALLQAGTVAVIGPIAEARAEGLGVRVDVLPSEPSAEALVGALVRACGT